ncbi:MAG: TetR/AcrR family transcriptional regulator [Actinobacteria bacterium]|nr:TetR/AcrR family transcriptional regulator [Actinomycetota bacterium]
MAATSTRRRKPFGTNPEVGERGTETESRILTAALEVFAESGFAASRVELITERSGCSRPAFYQYFSSKDDVFWRLGRRLGRALVDLGRSLGPVGPDAEGVATLTDWMDDFVDLYLEYAAVFEGFQSATRETVGAAQDSSGVAQRLDDALVRAFGVGRTRENRALASVIAAIIYRCTFYWKAMSAVGEFERERLTRGLAFGTHRLFLGPIPGVNVPRRRHRGPVRPVDFDRPGTPTTDPTLRPRGLATRRSLLDAGAQILPTHGYHDARVDDIAELARVSRGSFYRYFEDKDDFFRVLAGEAGDAMIDLLERFPTGDDRDELRTWLNAWFILYDSNGGVITVWQEMQQGGGDLVTYSQQVAAAIVGGLVEMFTRAGHDDPLFDALVLLALIERLPYRTYTLGYETPARAIDAASTTIRRVVMGFDAS